MTQLFKALADLPVDLGLVHSTHVTAHNHPELQVQGI